MSPEIEAIWDAIDPDKLDTMDRALDHLRASLAEGLCPNCATTLVLDPEDIYGRSVLVCLGCPQGFPMKVPDSSVAVAPAEIRHGIALILRKIRR
jgi:hypothetical protein